MNHLRLLAFRYLCCYLAQITSSGQIQCHIRCHFGKPVVDLRKAIWLHRFEIEHLVILVSRSCNTISKRTENWLEELTSPWRAGEDQAMHSNDELQLPNCMFCGVVIQSQNLKAVSAEPGNLVRNAINLRILLCAFQCGTVLLYGVDPLPSP